MRRKHVVFIINQFIRNIVVGPPKTEKLLIVKKRFYKKSEAVARRCSVKKLFLEISQNSQENTCTRVSFLIKLQA